MRPHLNFRRNNVRELRDRQSENANAADNRHQNRDNDRDDRAIDEELGHLKLGMVGLVGFGKCGPFCRRRPALCHYRSALSNLLNALHDHLFTGFNAFFDFPHRPEAVTDFHRADTRLVITADDGNLIIALQICNGFLRDKERAFPCLGSCADAGKLTGTQNISRIWKRGFEADRPSLYINVAIEGVKFSFLRIDRSVG